MQIAALSAIAFHISSAGLCRRDARSLADINQKEAEKKRVDQYNRNRIAYAEFSVRLVHSRLFVRYEISKEGIICSMVTFQRKKCILRGGRRLNLANAGY